MTTNLFTRLRALLPAPPLLIARVVSIDTEAGTSVVEIPASAGAAVVAPGLSTGSTWVARGTSVAVGSMAWIRAGVIESEAPSGDVVEAVIGSVVGAPFGPAALALAAVPDQASAVGAPVSIDLAALVSGGWPPLVWSVASGTLPAGLVLDAATGVVSGTRSDAVARSVTLAVEDSTHARVESSAVAFGVG